MIESWPLEWRAPNLVELYRKAAQKRKDEANFHVMQLTKKRHNKKVAAKVRAVRKVEKEATE